MSNERSPREVCSITIGINGLIELLLAGRGPQSCRWLVSFLLRGPELLARSREVGGDPLDLGRDVIEGAGEAKRLALLLPAARLAELRDRLVGVLVAGPELVLELLVRDRDAELVGCGLEHELAGDRLLRLRTQALDELVAGGAGDLDIGVERDAAALEREREPLEQCPRTRLDERPRSLHLRGLDERADDLLPECGLALELEVFAQARLDLLAQLGQRLELARRAREVVVERRKHLLLDLLDGGLDRRRRVVRELGLDRLRLADRHSDEPLLELVEEAALAQLDDVVALRLAPAADEVDDERVAIADRPVLDRDELGDGAPQRLELPVDELRRHVGLGVGHLEPAPV